MYQKHFLVLAGWFLSASLWAQCPDFTPLSSRQQQELQTVANFLEKIPPMLNIQPYVISSDDQSGISVPEGYCPHPEGKIQPLEISQMYRLSLDYEQPETQAKINAYERLFGNMTEDNTEQVMQEAKNMGFEMAASIRMGFNLAYLPIEGINEAPAMILAPLPENKDAAVWRTLHTNSAEPSAQDQLITTVVLVGQYKVSSFEQPHEAGFSLLSKVMELSQPAKSISEAQGFYLVLEGGSLALHDQLLKDIPWGQIHAFVQAH